MLNLGSMLVIMEQGGKSGAIIYCRLSEARDEEGRAGLIRQQQDCRAYCDRNGIEVVDVYEEVESAFNGKHRPKWDSALARIRVGEADALVVWKLDRATRRGVVGLGKILEFFSETGASFHSVIDNLDTSTNTGEIMASIIAGLAKGESANTSMRVARAEQALAEAGKAHGGGWRPFGYDREMNQIPEEVALIRGMREKVLIGVSGRQMAKEMNELGILTTAGRPWSSSSVLMMLKSPRLAGVRTHNGQSYPGAWTPVFTPEEWADLQAAFGTWKIIRRPDEETGILVRAGLIYCGRCNTKLRWSATTVNNRRYPRYSCGKDHPGAADRGRGCGSLAIGQINTDTTVLEEAKHLLQSELRPQDDEREIEAIRAEVDALAKRLAEWNDVFLNGELERAEWLEGRTVLQKKLSTAQGALDRRTAAREAAHRIGGGRHDPENIDVAALRDLFEKIVIHPATKIGGVRIFERHRVEFHASAELFERLIKDWPEGRSVWRAGPPLA